RVHSGRNIGSREQHIDVIDPRPTIAKSRVSTAPTIKPVPALGVPAIAGRIGTVTFTPAMAGVVSYRYSFGAGTPEQSVPAKPDGTATVDFTPDQAGWRVLTAVSIDADGDVSDRRTYPIVVAD